MERPNNPDSADRPSQSKQREPEGASENVSGGYYYDDSTGYEVFRDDEDEEPQSDDGEIRDNA